MYLYSIRSCEVFTTSGEHVMGCRLQLSHYSSGAPKICWIISRGCSCFGPMASLQLAGTNFSICLHANHSQDIIAHMEGHGVPYAWHFLSCY